MGVKLDPEADGTRNRATTGLWSDMVYEGIEVYSMGVMYEVSGVAGESR